MTGGFSVDRAALSGNSGSLGYLGQEEQVCLVLSFLVPQKLIETR